MLCPRKCPGAPSEFSADVRGRGLSVGPREKRTYYDWSGTGAEPLGWAIMADNFAAGDRRSECQRVNAVANIAVITASVAIGYIQVISRMAPPAASVSFFLDSNILTIRKKKKR